jgi:hypothetical protein
MTDTPENAYHANLSPQAEDFVTDDKTGEWLKVEPCPESGYLNCRPYLPLRRYRRNQVTLKKNWPPNQAPFLSHVDMTGETDTESE